MPEVLLRFLVAAGIMILGYLLYRWIMSASLKKARNASIALAAAGRDRTILLYFTSQNCVPCKVTQRPIIEKLKVELGDCIEVIEIDTETQGDLARDWGVLSVPTTVILGRDGSPRRINIGVTSLSKLTQQISG